MKKKLFTIDKKDFDIQTFCSGGPGGQHQNKTESGVRLVHRASGAVGESRTHRSQLRNKREALLRLTQNPKFKVWLIRQSAALGSGKTIEETVEEQMEEKNLRIEGQVDGRWAPLDMTVQGDATAALERE